jgi:hypothetical protein
LIELERLGLGVAGLEVELEKSHLASTNFNLVHEARAHPVSALIGSHPQTFDLAEQ